MDKECTTCLALMECLCLDFPLLFESVNNILVSPSDFVRQALFPTMSVHDICVRVLGTHLDSAVLSTRLQPQHPQSLRNHHPFLAVVWWRNTLEQFQTFKGSGTARGLVGNHATDRAEEDFRGCTVVEGTRFLGVDNVTFVQEVVVAQLIDGSG